MSWSFASDTVLLYSVNIGAGGFLLNWLNRRRAADRAAKWPALACLLLFWALGVRTVVSQTVTVDEPVHILRGHALWQLGDLRFQFEHTPLSHWLNGSLLDLPNSMEQIT